MESFEESIQFIFKLLCVCLFDQKDETKVFTSIGLLERPIAIESIDGSV